MGKAAFNPLSQWRGRVGGQVYKVVNGKQVIQPYYAREGAKGGSLAQMSVRARFALAGKYSKITPPEILRGMDGSKTDRRGRFVKLITQKSTVSLVDGNIQAAVAPENVVFSEGYVVPIALGTPAITAAGVLTATATDVPESVDAILGIAVIENAEGEYDRIEYAIVPVDGETHTATITVDTSAFEGAHVRFYDVPLTTTEEARSFMATTEYDEHAADQYTLTMLLTSVESAYKWGRSNYVGELVVPAA